jgi:hypothetical protein
MVTILEALQSLLASLEERCGSLYGSAEVLRTHAAELRRHNLIGHGEFDPAIAAFTGTGCTNVPEQEAAIVWNRLGGAFDSRFTILGARGGTPEARLRIWLHELGHSLEVIPPDAFSVAASRQNDETIDSQCRGTILKALGR